MEMLKLFSLFIVGVLVIVPSKGSPIETEANWIAKLRSHLLENYTNEIRPVNDHLSNVSLQIAISLNNLELDELTQTMTAVTLVNLFWTDEFLTWNPADYGNIEQIHLNTDEIWMPDLALFNSATKASVSPTSELPLLCLSGGQIIWVPQFIGEVPCRMDISAWPADLHTCTLRFGSWAHHDKQIDLRLRPTSPIDVDFHAENTRWRLVNYSAALHFLSYGEDHYPFADFVFVVERKAASHAAYVTQTAFAVMLIVLGSYVLPLCYHKSRLLLHLFALVLLSMCNFVMFMSLPANGDDIPHVVRYFAGTIILTSLSLVCNILMATAFSSKLHFNPKLLGGLGNILPAEVPSGSNGQIAYSTLDEEMIEFSQVDVDDSSTRQIRGRKIVNVRTLFRLANGILFLMFFLAYIIDYSVMRNSIGY